MAFLEREPKRSHHAKLPVSGSCLQRVGVVEACGCALNGGWAHLIVLRVPLPVRKDASWSWAAD